MSDGVLCKCGHPMHFVMCYPIYDHLNNNHFVDIEFYCGNCDRFKYIRCAESTVLDIDNYDDYHPCMERRELMR